MYRKGHDSDKSLRIETQVSDKNEDGVKKKKKKKLLSFSLKKLATPAAAPKFLC